MSSKALSQLRSPAKRVERSIQKTAPAPVLSAALSGGGLAACGGATRGEVQIVPGSEAMQRLTVQHGKGTERRQDGDIVAAGAVCAKMGAVLGALYGCLQETEQVGLTPFGPIEAAQAQATAGNRRKPQATARQGQMSMAPRRWSAGACAPRTALGRRLYPWCPKSAW
jgi:hypothetical protein